MGSLLICSTRSRRYTTDFLKHFCCCSGPELKISTTMGVLSIASLAIIFAVVRSTTSTASGQTPGASWPAMRPNVHSPLKRRVAVPTTTSTASDQTSSVPAMRPNVHEVHIHKRPHSGMTSTMLGQHSMPEHRPQHRPMMTQKPIPETAPLSGEADTEENTMSQAMSEDMIEDNTMAGQELIDDPESDEAMIEEMSEHEDMISVHEFKEVLLELVEEAVDKIVEKKAGIVGKFKTAKQNLFGLDREAMVRDPQLLGLALASILLPAVPQLIGTVAGTVAQAIQPPRQRQSFFPGHFCNFPNNIAVQPPRTPRSTTKDQH